MPVTVVLTVARDAHDLDVRVDGEGAALGATRDDGATTGDREDVLDGHEERLVLVADGLRDGLVDRVHELDDLLDPLLVALERLEAGDLDDGGVVAVEVLAGEQLADLELDELEDLLVVDHVRLVERDEQVRHADLLREQHVLARLRHGAVGGGDHEDRAVHLRRARDHVLDVVSVTRGVDVSVVTLGRLVLDVRDVDRDAALALLGSGVDGREVALHVGRRRVLVRQDLGDRCRQRRLAVVDVTDRSDVDVRLGPLELGLTHCGSSSGLGCGASGCSRTPCVLEILLMVLKRRMPLELEGYSPLFFWTISSATAFGTSA